MKKIIPVKDISGIYAFGEISINSKLLQFLTKNQIPIYFFNYYGYYSGVYAPRKEQISGKLLVKEVTCYTDKTKRMKIAREFLKGAFHNMRKTLMQYNLEEGAEKLKNKMDTLETIKDNQKLLLYEAEIRKFYYQQFNKITKNKEFEFVKRTRNPPDNYINTLISFGNSLLYTTTLSEIYKTQLNPTIAYLHEPFEKRYSLNLDISEIFKPLIVDRVIFNLINKQMINPEHFDKELNYCFLNEAGRKLFLKEYDNKLKTTLKHPTLKRKVSYRYLIRLECYKLIKHFLEDEPYKTFKIYW